MGSCPATASPESHAPDVAGLEPSGSVPGPDVEPTRPPAAETSLSLIAPTPEPERVYQLELVDATDVQPSGYERRVEIDRVVAAYQRHHPRAKPGQKHRTLIADRLNEGFSAEDLVEAIEGNHMSEWHCGKNPTGSRYHGLELIVRNADKVNQFIEVARQPRISHVARLPLSRLDAQVLDAEQGIESPATKVVMDLWHQMKAEREKNRRR